MKLKYLLNKTLLKKNIIKTLHDVFGLISSLSKRSLQIFAFSRWAAQLKAVK